MKRRLLSIVAALGLLVGAIGFTPVVNADTGCHITGGTITSKSFYYTEEFWTAFGGFGLRESQYKINATGCYRASTGQSQVMSMSCSYVDGVPGGTKWTGPIATSMVAYVVNGQTTADFRCDYTFAYFGNGTGVDFFAGVHDRLKLWPSGGWGAYGTLTDHFNCGNSSCTVNLYAHETRW